MARGNFSRFFCVLCNVTFLCVSPVEISEQYQFLTLLHCGVNFEGTKSSAESCFRVSEGVDQRLPWVQGYRLRYLVQSGYSHL